MTVIGDCHSHRWMCKWKSQAVRTRHEPLLSKSTIVYRDHVVPSPLLSATPRRLHVNYTTSLFLVKDRMHAFFRAFACWTHRFICSTVSSGFRVTQHAMNSTISFPLAPLRKLSIHRLDHNIFESALHLASTVCCEVCISLTW